MNINTYTPDQLSSAHVQDMAKLTALGFGDTYNDAVLKDTIAHVMSADQISTSVEAGELVGFSMLRRQLWRVCA